MIGLDLHWGHATRSPDRAARFAASLGMGHVGAAQHRSISGATYAQAGARRGWSPALTACGARLLFTGYLQNAAEIATRLGVAATDPAALYAAAYDAWGDRADRELIGVYATILHDPDQARVRLSSSPISTRPLHIYRGQNELIIASTPRAIFATGAVEQRLDEQKLADTMFLNYHEGQRSWFAGIERLGAGSHAIITPDSFKSESYYDIAAFPPVRLKRDEDYVEAARDLLNEGMRASLDGFSKPALALSGGLDSSLALTAWCDVRGKEAPLDTFTICPEPEWDGRTAPHRFGDERPHVEALLEHYPAIRPHWLDTRGLALDDKLDAIIMMSHGAPRNAMHVQWSAALHDAAKDQGCDVLIMASFSNFTLSFDGDGMLPSLMRSGRWRALAREINAMKGANSFARTWMARAVMPLLPEAMRSRISTWRHGPLPGPFDTWSPINRDWAAEMKVEERAELFDHDADYGLPRSTHDVRRTGLGNARSEVPDSQQASDLIYGIPTRDPTAYRPLVEFCFGIPDDQYLRGGVDRWLARRMLAGRVPALIVNERRRGLQIADWHLRIGRERHVLGDALDRLAANPAMARRFDVKALKAALDDWPDETPIGTNQAKRLFLGLPRALATARFIQSVEGRNDI